MRDEREREVEESKEAGEALYTKKMLAGGHSIGRGFGVNTHVAVCTSAAGKADDFIAYLQVGGSHFFIVLACTKPPLAAFGMTVFSSHRHGINSYKDFLAKSGRCAFIYR